MRETDFCHGMGLGRNYRWGGEIDLSNCFDFGGQKPQNLIASSCWEHSPGHFSKASDIFE